jgi:hypothetical protein
VDARHKAGYDGLCGSNFDAAFFALLMLTRPKPTHYVSPRAQVAELVDALVSGTSGASREGSSPFLGTNRFQPFPDCRVSSRRPVMWTGPFTGMIDRATTKDEDGRALDGASDYRLNMPVKPSGSRRSTTG